MSCPACLPRIVSLLLMVLPAAPAAARARDQALDAPRSPVLAASSCPALFGTAEEHARNARAKRHLYWVHEELEGITVAHSSDQWTEPVELELQGAQLLAGGRERASVRVSAALGKSLGCKAGDYAVGRDDRIGLGTRVLAVLQSGVLLEKSGRLAFLRAAGGADPRWLLAWSAPGTVKLPEGGGEQTAGLYDRVRYRGEIY